MIRILAFAIVLTIMLLPAAGAADVPVQLLWDFTSGGHHIRCVSEIADQEGYVPASPEVLVEIDNTGDPQGHFKLLRGSDGGVMWGVSPVGGLSDGCGYGDMCVTSCPDLTGDNVADALLGTSWGGRTAYAIVANDSGRILWDFDTYADDPPSGWVYSVDWVDDVTGDGLPDVIFGCGSDNNSAYCVNGATGALRWSFTAPDAVYQVARIRDVNGNGTDDVLVGTGDTYADYTYCIEGGSVGAATYLWRFYVGDTTFCVAGTDDVDGDSVPDALIGTWDASGNVYCVSGADGSEIWRHGVGSYENVMRVLPIKDLNDDECAEVLVASWANWILCLDGRTGDQYWSVTTGSTNGGDVWAIWPLGDVDYDGYHDVIAGSFDLKAYCVSGHTGTLLWDYTVGNRVYTVRGIGDVNNDQVSDAIVGTQYYSGTGGKVFCLDADGDATGIAPVSDLVCSMDGDAVSLAWRWDSGGDVVGFNVYRAVVEPRETPAALRERLSRDGSFTVAEALTARSAPGRGDEFVRLNDDFLTRPAYRDGAIEDGVHYAYMVGAISADGREELEGPVSILAVFEEQRLWLAAPTPNPSRGFVELSFSIPGGVDASLSVYSPDGRLVRRVADGLSGRGSIAWNGLTDDGRRVAEGVYMVRLIAGRASANRKVVLVR
ncbi:MAG: PQQ-binding-like beta-propeller repeat protein [Candidatus Eisenbacteria bacterium]|nr:PQQ-binding-like beta-propeller repeat protein [Candidatus Eisenbacteria bacterium]